MGMPAGMANFLNRKYAIQQQQANDGSRQVAIAARQAATTDRASRANEELTRAQAANVQARTGVIPQVTMAEIAQMGANTNLLGVQARVLPFETAAQIRASDANANFTDAQRAGLLRENFDAVDGSGTQTARPTAQSTSTRGLFGDAEDSPFDRAFGRGDGGPGVRISRGNSLFRLPRMSF